MKIDTKGRWFCDERGRTLLLRGVNLGGSSKVPRTPDGATWRRDGFYNHPSVSFVGRPFPLEEADEHFARLRHWGLTFLRLLVTWEAIEHAGPGVYDQQYLDYLYALARRAAGYDLQIVIDPHQDVWSRFSGGDGAPGWTFEALGMDITRFGATGAAVTHQERGDPYPRMLWPSNYSRFACATMFTLFFAGDDLASETRVDGVPVQQFLQRHYIGAVKQVALCLSDLPNVVGYDTLNEPSPGYIGCPDMHAIPSSRVAQGPSPTIYQGMLLAAGIGQEVAVKSLLSFPLGRARRVRLDPGGIGLWREGTQPVWRQNGVWDLDGAGRPHLLRPDHFSQVAGQATSFARDYFGPFIERYIRDIRSVHPGALIFVCPPPAELGPELEGMKLGQLDGLVYAPHWYDGLTLHRQRYVPWLGVDVHGRRARFVLGRNRRRNSFVQQIRRHVLGAETFLGAVPTLIGETGIAMNLNDAEAYRTGDYSQQVAAIDDTIQALEANLVSFTWWNYTADNDNQRGDRWNGEDLSIFSRDQQAGSEDLDDGGRALEAIVRPYAGRVPGEPLRMAFDPSSRVFEFEFRWDAGLAGPAELFVPEVQYPAGYQVEAPGGRWEADFPGQRLLYYPEEGRAVHRLRISPRFAGAG